MEASLELRDNKFEVVQSEPSLRIQQRHHGGLKKEHCCTLASQLHWPALVVSILAKAA